MKLLATVARHKRVAAAISAVVVVSIAVLAWWFQPWKLFVDETVDEGAPSLGPTAGASAPATPSVLSTGRFRSLEHETTGVATILTAPDGKRVVRLEDLRTSNGPDLVVMLSATPATEDGWRAYDDGLHVTLGKLKGNIGDQNYSVPPSVDLSRYRSVVIWCRRFTVGFGAAPLELRG